MTRRHPPNVAKPFPWLARLFVGLVFAAGVALSIYGGIVAGALGGLVRSTSNPTNTASGPGVGMAPDLSGPIDMFLQMGAGAVLRALGGLILGCLLMWVVCRFALNPLLRKLTA